jgi:hypothetical protein
MESLVKLQYLFAKVWDETKNTVAKATSLLTAVALPGAGDRIRISAILSTWYGRALLQPRSLEKGDFNKGENRLGRLSTECHGLGNIGRNMAVLVTDQSASVESRRQMRNGRAVTLLRLEAQIIHIHDKQKKRVETLNISTLRSTKGTKENCAMEKLCTNEAV